MRACKFERRSAILIKIADRLSNLHARIQGRKVGKGYAKKSSELLQYLFNSYTNLFGVTDKIQKMYDKYLLFNRQIVELHKKRDLGVQPPVDNRGKDMQKPEMNPSIRNVFRMEA